MPVRPMLAASVLLLATSFAGNAQSNTIDLAQFGYQKVMAGRYAKPAFASLSYVGDNALFVTYLRDDTPISPGQPFDYAGIVIDKTGTLFGKAQIHGSYDDVLQRRINIQPLANVLIKDGDKLKIYDLSLTSFRSLDLPPDSQIRVPPDRKTVIAISKDGNKSMDRIIKLQNASTDTDHLDFDELAVRNGLLAVANDGSVAHAVRDPDGELGIHSWSLRWPDFTSGKYQEPLAFTKQDELLVSVMEKRPFPPTNLYLWKANGQLRKIHGSEAGYYMSAQPSLDGTRVLVTEANVSYFLAMLGGFDCGNCGESYFYSVVDVPSGKVMLKHPQHWNCKEALSPNGKELAELCDGVIHFYPLPQ